MPAILQKDSYDIAYSAIQEMFMGEPDERGVCEAFADRWSTDFAIAMDKYIKTCIGLPPGGQVTPGPPVTLTLDIYNAMKNAFIDMFMGMNDEKNIADKFGAATSAVGPSIAGYIPTCMTILGTPPTMISPGGPVTAPPSVQLVPVFFAASRAAWVAAFLDSGDPQGIATKFATKFKETGKLIGDFVGRCISPPSGGPLQTTSVATPSSNAANILKQKAETIAKQQLAEAQAEAATKIEEEKEAAINATKDELKKKKNELIQLSTQLALMVAQGIVGDKIEKLKQLISLAEIAVSVAQQAYEAAKAAKEASKQVIEEAKNAKHAANKLKAEAEMKAEEAKATAKAEIKKKEKEAKNLQKKAEMQKKAADAKAAALKQKA